jgi:KDO2-lipid IV(A) lauroyltransferase
MTSLIQRVRESGGYKIIWRGKDGVFEDLQRLLAAGEFIGFLIDQDIKAKGVFVHFFGVKAFTPRAAADLALLTGAAVVTGFAFRRQDGGHRVEITRIPVPPSAPQVVDQEVVALTQTFTRAIEDAICRDPHAWVWMHQRWKTRPT